MSSRLPIPTGKPKGGTTIRSKSSKLVPEFRSLTKISTAGPKPSKNWTGKASATKPSKNLAGNASVKKPEEQVALGDQTQNMKPQASAQNSQTEVKIEAVASVEKMVTPVTSSGSTSNTQIGTPESGPEYSREIMIKRLKELKDLESSHYRGINEHKFKKHLVVSRFLGFSSDGNKNEFRGLIILNNTSNLTITFWIQASAPSKFEFALPPVGLIPPKSRVALEVYSDSSVGSFADIERETFMVLATPVFTKELTNVLDLTTYWKVFGSDWFPVNMAESHCIDWLVQKDTGNYTMAELIPSFPRTPDKYEFESINPDELYRAWEINGSLWNKNYVLDQQYKEYLKNTHISGIPLRRKQLASSFVIACFVVGAGWYIYEWFNQEPPVRSWYDTLCFWR